MKHAKRSSLSRWIGAIFLAVFAVLSPPSRAQVPAVIHYQGRVLANGVAFDGTGQFKFALVNADATQIYWRNSADTNSDGEPDAAVLAPVTRGLYSILLGDTSLGNMAALPNNLFTNASVYLRVWFADGSGAFEKLAPDQRIVAVGYAMIAATVTDGSISLDKLASDARTAIQSAASNTRADSLQSQISALSSRLDSLSLTQIAAPAGLTLSSSDPADAAAFAQGFVPFNTTTPPAWVNGATANAPSARFSHTAVWTGDSWIVWGGDLGGGVLSGGGAVYHPAADTWDAVASLNSPQGRDQHTAVWTGQQMIVWGGFSAGLYLSAGGLYNPATPEWTATQTTGVPTGRIGHVAVWTGSKMLIWGGRNSNGLLNDGALYDPVANQWTALTASNPPEARQNAAYVWAGDRLIVWGGTGVGGPLNTGAQLTFSGGVPTAWTALTASSAPSARVSHSMIWTGQKAIIWGGSNGGNFLGDGGAYDPIANTWQSLPGSQAPAARAEHAAIWNGGEMIIFGGDSAAGALATGAAYDPVANRWRTLTNGGGPLARIAPTGVWTGSEFLVFGGHNSAQQPLSALQRVNPQPAWTFYRKP